MERDADLLEIIGALGAPGGFSGGLNGREEQSDQHGDDRDHNQKLDQGESMDWIEAACWAFH